MATPYLDEAERCARVALLHDGQLLAVDAPTVLRKRLGEQIVEVVTDTARPPLETLAGLAGVEDVQAFGERAHVRVAGSAAERALAIRSSLEEKGIRVTSVRPVAASLEDVFIDLITPSGGGQTGVRPGSGRGQTGVRPGSDQGQAGRD
jgi:ABC-2 type transport system ATP-binding protein